MDNTYYEILEVDRNATKEVLHKQKINLLRKWHPDKLPADKQEEGTLMTQKINEAYDILSDDKKREIYDRFGKDGLDGNMHGHGGMPDFSEMFGGGGFPFEGFPFSHGHNRNRDVRPKKDVEIELTLEEYFNGKTINKTINRYDPCNDCCGTGYEDKKVHTCNDCKGEGIVNKHIRQGHQVFVIQEPCRKCNGTGTNGNGVKKCVKCKGNKITHNTHNLIHELKKGMKKTVVIVGEGDYFKSSRGDVVLHIKILPHHLFKVKDEYDLEITINITLEEALCGFSTSFTYLDGTTKYIDIHDIISNNEKKVIKDCGLPKSSYKNGDLYITFKVDIPDNLTNDQRNKIYYALTGKEFDPSQIHDIPVGVEPMLLRDPDPYETKTHDTETSDDDDNNPRHHRAQNVQCAQQ